MDNNGECCQVGKSFFPGPELLGSKAMVTAGLFGFTSLQVLYLHEELDCELSSKFKWADVDFLAQAIQREKFSDIGVVHKTMGDVHEFIGANGATKLALFTDHPFHRMFSMKTASWLSHWFEYLGEIELCRPVPLHISRVTSTIFKVETSQGRYFLKALCINLTKIETHSRWLN